eukprot:TRINITY_DN2904_c0_g1_i1.p1 TRINITY_DN2904_c0_g1~~TRINITY_DN2904_c0_g1_i1.p1  ORF type:complete len:464 (+),score=44.31 TRINITY_DN2904_c0_g1_i1:153-1544(+)
MSYQCQPNTCYQQPQQPYYGNHHYQQEPAPYNNNTVYRAEPSYPPRTCEDHQCQNFRPKRRVRRHQTRQHAGNDQPICLDWLKGVCARKRWKCKFAHPSVFFWGNTEKKTASPPNRPHIQDQRKRRSRTLTRPICGVWILTGFCKFGSSCRDYHPPLDIVGGPVCPPALTSKLTGKKYEPEAGENEEFTAPDAPEEDPADEQATSEEEHRAMQVILKRAMGILNRLSPERFDTLMAQFCDLLSSNVNEDTGKLHVGLQVVLPLVFTKAIAEPERQDLYARLVQFLHTMVAPEERQFLLNQLLQLSNRLLYEVVDVPSNHNTEDEERALILRTQRVGNVSFLSYLYLEGVIPLQSLLTKMDFLLEQSGEHVDKQEASLHVELLCRVLGVMGSVLDKIEPARVDMYLDGLKARLDGLGMRPLVLLENIEALRRNGWGKAGAHTPPRGRAQAAPPSPARANSQFTS